MGCSSLRRALDNVLGGGQVQVHEPTYQSGQGERASSFAAAAQASGPGSMRVPK